MASSEQANDSPAERPDPGLASANRTPPGGAAALGPLQPDRVLPGRWRSVCLLARSDLEAVWRSWLCRSFLLVSLLLTLLQLKGMQAEQKVASQMLEAVYVTYLLVWMHGVIFMAGAALSREQECLNDSILSRGLTRGEYLGGKLAARWLAVLIMVGGVLFPASFWAIRQDALVRTDQGYVTSHARNTQVEAWDPKKVFAATEGTVVELNVDLGDSVHAGDVLALLDDRYLFDQLEVERRAEQNARNEVQNAQRRYEDARRAVAQAEDALAKAERGLVAKDLLSKTEQADRETEVRTRKRELTNGENQLLISRDAITAAERSVEDAQARVREARKRLGYATVTAPISGYVTERLVQAGEHAGVGTHLLTLAPLDEYQVEVPIYRFEEFKRLKKGLTAYITIEDTEFEGAIERLGATTKEDRWGRPSNYALVRFRNQGTLGLLGLNADVRLVLPALEEKPNQVTSLLNTLTGRGVDDVESRTASVTPGWMLIGLGKVIGCASLLVALTLLTLTLFRSALISILTVTGLWHVSNILFDFVGLPDLSYLEMIRTMDKVLGGVADPVDETTGLVWLFGLAALCAIAALTLFISRDPLK